jgi:tetratricopeptide (TPR) repeat protein
VIRRGLPLVSALAAGALLVAGSSPVRADTPPSAWDKARDPGAGDRWALHARVERMLDPVGGEDASPVDDELRLQVARSILEEADAEHSPDLRLRIDLALVYGKMAENEHRLDLDQKVIDLLAPIVEQAPGHEEMREALHALCAAYMRFDRPHEEIATWRRLIALVVGDRFRIVPMMNMGEALMRLGRLGEARETFEDAIRLYPSIPNTSNANLTYALLLWDMAVVLDRSGDPQRALDTAKTAEEWNWGQVVGVGNFQTARSLTGWDAIRDSKNVFFVPEWERDWYLALGYGAAARATPDPRDGAKLWAEAEAHWTTYIDGASSRTPPDRWLPVARVRREHAHAERVADERRGAKLPPRAAAPGITSWSDP